MVDLRAAVAEWLAHLLAVRKAQGFEAQPTKRASCVLLIMRLPHSSGWAYTVNRICLGQPSLSSSRGRQIGTWLPLVSFGGSWG